MALAFFYSFVSQPPPAMQESNSCSSTADSMWSRLPEEVVSHIVDFAYYDEDLQADHRTLSSCALVCKGWSIPSQTLLFRHVFLRSSSAFVSFRSAVDPSTIRGQNLRSKVVRLRVTIDHNHPNQLSHRALAAAILSCPNLYELDLAIYGCSIPSVGGATGVRVFRAAPSFDADTLDLLRAGPAVRSLKFANWSDNDQLAFQLLSDVWPSLMAVSLQGTPPRLPAFGDRPILPFACALSELRISFQGMPCSDFMAWLLQNSICLLRCLELEQTPGAEFVGSLLRQCGPSLESLALPSCTSREHVSVIHGCENLKEFRFESSNISPFLLKQLPGSVEHLAFSVSRDTPLYLIVNFVKARRHLKAVTVHVWDDAESHPQMPNLRIACACNGVELLIVRGIRRFREAVRGDPVPCSSYPRLKEPANLRRMLYIARHARAGEVLGSSERRQRPRAESAAAKLSRRILSSPEFAVASPTFNASDSHHEKS